MIFQSFKPEDNIKRFLDTIRKNCTLGEAVRSITILSRALDRQPNILEDLLTTLPLMPKLQDLDIPTDGKILSKIEDKLEKGLISLDYLQGLDIRHNDWLYWKDPARFPREKFSTLYSCMQRLPQLTCLNIETLGSSTLHDKAATLASLPVQQLKLCGCLDKHSLHLLLQGCHNLELFDYYHPVNCCKARHCNSFTSLDLYEELLPHAQSIQELSISLPDFACMQWESAKSLSNLAHLNIDSEVLSGRPTLPPSLRKIFIRCYACEDLSSVVEYLNGEIRLHLNQVPVVCIRAEDGVKLPEWAHGKIHVHTYGDPCTYAE
jgi:hypothetical protein